MDGAGNLLHSIDARTLALRVCLRKIADLIERNSPRCGKGPVHHTLLLCLHWGGFAFAKDGRQFLHGRNTHRQWLHIAVSKVRMELYNFALVEVEMRARVDNVVVGGHIDDLHSVVKVEGDGLCVGGAPLLYLEGPLDGLCC